MTIPAGQTSQTVTVAAAQGARRRKAAASSSPSPPTPPAFTRWEPSRSRPCRSRPRIAAAPVVGVVAPPGTVSKQGGQPGTFVISRSGSTAGAMTVSYTLGGTAPAGSYLVNGVASPGPGGRGNVIIPAGQSSATVAVTPVNDGLVTGDRSVQLVLGAGLSYTVGRRATTPW